MVMERLRKYLENQSLARRFTIGPAGILKNPLQASETAPSVVESLPSSEHLIATEKQALSAFFGKDIAVPEPPAELFQTLEKMSKLGITGFEPHFLPQFSLTEEDQLPGWKVKPNPCFWLDIKAGRFPADAATLQEGWYLVDKRKKPNYHMDKQRYENDYVEPIIQDLRKTDKIKKDNFRMPETSRFRVTPDEIEQVILPEIVRIIGTKGELTNKRYIEFNVWGNMFYPEWGQTNTCEWFADKLGDDRWLRGGNSSQLYNGLENVRLGWPGERFGDGAFNPVIRFPSKPR